MVVILNGESTELPEGLTLQELVQRLGLERSACAAEVNRSLVPKSERGRLVLRDGDRIELVVLVGGG